MSFYYICDDDFSNVRAVPLLEWAAWFENTPRRIVKRTELPHGAVSTVFLGLNHCFGDDGQPVVFETMIFAPDLDCDQWQARASTVEDARAQHAEALAYLGQDPHAPAHWGMPD